MDEAREAYFDNGESTFSQLPSLRRHLGRLAISNLQKRAGKVLAVDLATGRKELTCGQLLTVGLALSARWKKRLPNRRVGVVFPSGLGGLVANLALTLADKVPVNLNFTSGRAALEACIRKAGIDTIVTTRAVREKLSDFPWTPRTLDLLEEREKLGKGPLLAAALAARLPAGWTAEIYGVPRQGGEREAGLLFSSGSTGTPKGIPLSHRNIIANCEQITAVGLLQSEETLLACLPTFHSFGFTVTLWYPLLTGLKIVCLPSPLDVKKIIQAVREEKITVLVGTPTFFRPYFKKATKADLQSVRYVVAGAEKTPPGMADRWEEIFGHHYLEGYGLTETSPVVGVNLPARKLPGQRTSLPAEIRRGSIGRLFPGMSARIVDPASGRILRTDEVGMLELRGPNVFSGYLDDPQLTDSVFRENWFITGDLARLDRDGYLFIEGRVSRFSKIGGEMVPHGTVETAIQKVLGLEEAENPQVAVAGITDPQKGESLVVFATLEIDPQQLRQQLSEAGLPNLWIPRRIERVEKIPVLATGKLDLQAIARLAENSARISPAVDN